MNKKENKVHPITLFQEKDNHHLCEDDCQHDDLDFLDDDALASHPQLSPEVAAALYEMAFNYYTNGKYQESIDVFYLLILTDSENPKYWMGIAAAHQMLKEFEDAISGYAFVAMLDEENPLPHLHAAECFFAMKDNKQALEALDAVFEVSGNKKMHKETLVKATALRDAWSRKD